MPDESTSTNGKEIKQPENPIVLSPTRNGVEQLFKEQRTTRGKNPGKTIFDPVTSNDDEKQKFLDWVGAENVFSIVKAKVRSLTSGWVDEATDEETGEFNSNKFISFAEDFSARGETIGELKDQLEDTQVELTKLDLSSSDPAVTSRFLELGKQIQKLTIAIESKKRPRNTPATAEVA